MARAMFEYTKTVLEKVSFSVELFQQELKKALKRLLPDEIIELKHWLLDFTRKKPELIPCISIIDKV